MSSRLGLDWWDVGIHVLATVALSVGLAASATQAQDAIFGLTWAGSAVLFGVRRSFALRRQPPGITTGEVQAERLSDLEDRMAELESLIGGRVQELEERVDFTERMLAGADRAPEAGHRLPH